MTVVSMSFAFSASALRCELLECECVALGQASIPDLSTLWQLGRCRREAGNGRSVEACCRARCGSCEVVVAWQSKPVVKCNQFSCQVDVLEVLREAQRKRKKRKKQQGNREPGDDFTFSEVNGICLAYKSKMK